MNKFMYIVIILVLSASTTIIAKPQDQAKTQVKAKTQIQTTVKDQVQDAAKTQVQPQKASQGKDQVQVKDQVQIQPQNKNQIQSQEIMSGLTRLSIDNQSYKSYLKKITYATPIVLPSPKSDLSELTKNSGKRITLLGFVKYFSQKDGITTGYLYDSIEITPDDTKSKIPTNVMFETRERFTYKPFEVYQVTGVINEIASNSLASFIINADFAEAQGEFSRTIKEPNIADVVKETPIFKWFWLSQNFDPDFAVNDSNSLAIPEEVKKLENKIVKIQAWFHNHNASTENEVREISSLHPAGDSCQQCNSQTKNHANTASMTLRNKMPKNLRGGIFAGRLSLNSKENWSKLGVFTIKDAVLVSTMTFSQQVANSPETNGR